MSYDLIIIGGGPAATAGAGTGAGVAIGFFAKYPALTEKLDKPRNNRLTNIFFMRLLPLLKLNTYLLLGNHFFSI